MFIHTFCLYMGGVERVKYSYQSSVIDPSPLMFNLQGVITNNNTQNFVCKNIL